MLNYLFPSHKNGQCYCIGDWHLWVRIIAESYITNYSNIFWQQNNFTIFSNANSMSYMRDLTSFTFFFYRCCAWHVFVAPNQQVIKEWQLITFLVPLSWTVMLGRWRITLRKQSNPKLHSTLKGWLSCQHIAQECWPSQLITSHFQPVIEDWLR